MEKHNLFLFSPMAGVPGPMNEKIRELQDELLELDARSQTIQATADGENNRPLTGDEEKEIKGIFARFDDIQAEIERRELIISHTAQLMQPQGRQTDAQEPELQNAPSASAPAQPTGHPRKIRESHSPNIQVLGDRGKWGWSNLGEFAIKVKAASAKGGPLDPRLVANAPTTYSQEGVGTDGGFAVPPEFKTEIWQKVSGEDSLLARTDMIPTSKNSLVIPADESTPWDSSGGLQVYFESEAGQMTQSKVALQEKSIRLNKLTALVPVTEELMEDAPGLDGYLRKRVGEKFDFKLNLKIVQGAGAGEPMGILAAPSLVSITKETAQEADTIMTENINKMWARLYAPCRRNAIWLINQDIEPQLEGMTIGVGTGGVPVYMPPGGLADTPYGRLKGRPVIPTQACETLGDKGDIILVDLSKYLTAYKTGGVRTDVSMHLWFDYDVMAYRFILRIAGMPWWGSYITPRDGSNYLSWAITLDERA